MRAGLSFTIVMLLAAVGAARAETSCGRLIAKITREFEVAHKMSPADRAPKCRAYSMVTLHAMDIGTQCRAQSYMAVINLRYVPVAKALGADEQAHCGSP